MSKLKVVNNTEGFFKLEGRGPSAPFHLALRGTCVGSWLSGAFGLSSQSPRNSYKVGYYVY